MVVVAAVVGRTSAALEVDDSNRFSLYTLLLLQAVVLYLTPVVLDCNPLKVQNCIQVGQEAVEILGTHHDVS